VETKGLPAIPGGNERILFIDDEKDLVDIGERMPRHLGYEVVATTSSIKAMEIFRAKPDKFDLVITDQTMPNMTGAALAGELVRIRPGIPIILCTGFSDVITPEKAKALGIRNFVMKPVAIDRIAETIKSVLDSQPVTCNWQLDHAQHSDHR
jgi:two-component system cell cycle sensor histidine kinase/response regulator CckA